MSEPSFALEGDGTKFLEPPTTLGAGLSPEGAMDVPRRGTSKGGTEGPPGIAASLPRTPLGSSSCAPARRAPAPQVPRSTGLEWRSGAQRFPAGP